MYMLYSIPLRFQALKDSKSSSGLAMVKLVDNFDAQYSYITNKGKWEDAEMKEDVPR